MTAKELGTIIQKTRKAQGMTQPQLAIQAGGLGDRSWKMKRTKLSKRPTTRWDELMVVR